MTHLTKKKSTHPLAAMYGEEWAAEAERRIRLKEIEEQVAATTREILLKGPLSTEERIFSKKSRLCAI